MALFKLSLEDVYRTPENFLYIFASESFCKAMGTKAGNIIRGKKANQNKVLMQSAQNAGLQYNDYTTQIRAGFIDAYGMTPAEALVRLAKGESVAGKNWSEGVYGVGALYNSTFNQNGHMSVDPTTGKILVDGVEAQGQKEIVGSNKFPNCIQGYSYTDGEGNTWVSQYRTIKKKYFASEYSDKNGNKQNSSGTTITNADGSSIWSNLLTQFEQFINWLLSLFSGSTEIISADNTSPSQSDGFVTQEAGLGTVGVVLLASVAAGTLLMGGKGNKKGKKK